MENIWVTKSSTVAAKPCRGHVKVKCEVPQGSIVGPVFFHVCMNDISQCRLNGEIKLFAGK